MNAKQAENLRILIRHMETNVTRTLDMNRVFNQCGTPACAIGEACMVPALGMAYPDLANSGYCVLLHGQLTSYGTAAEIVFGVKDCLFGDMSDNAFKSNDVAPQEWVAEARKVLAENGYSMDDGFAAFKAKVLEPVALEAESTLR